MTALDRDIAEYNRKVTADVAAIISFVFAVIAALMGVTNGVWAAILFVLGSIAVLAFAGLVAFFVRRGVLWLTEEVPA